MSPPRKMSCPVPAEGLPSPHVEIAKFPRLSHTCQGGAGIPTFLPAAETRSRIGGCFVPRVFLFWLSLPPTRSEASSIIASLTKYPPKFISYTARPAKLTISASI
jgi:hypothetical protein